MAGAVSCCLGAYFLLARTMQTQAMLEWLGVYAGFGAIAILALAFRLHSLRAAAHELAQHSVSLVHK